VCLTLGEANIGARSYRAALVLDLLWWGLAICTGFDIVTLISYPFHICVLQI